jgi:hypothetical protein
VARVAGELEDVPLSDAEVFEKLPGRMLSAFGRFAAEVGGKVFDSLIEGGVRVAAFEKFEYMLAQGGVVFHGFRLLGLGWREGGCGMQDCFWRRWLRKESG